MGYSLARCMVVPVYSPLTAATEDRQKLSGRWRQPFSAAIAILITYSSAAARAEGSAGEGEKVFQRCASCHVVTGSDPARNGPSLQGIVGRAVASVGGYEYSPNMAALGAQGAIWDVQTLDGFLKYPSEFVKERR